MTNKREAKHNKDASGQPHDNTSSRSPELQDGKSQWFWKAVETANCYSNLIIAVATVFITALTVILAITATQQNNVAQRALELSSRPYISINIDPSSFFAESEQKMRLNILIRNSGGIPADARIRGTVIHSISKLSSSSLDMTSEKRN